MQHVSITFSPITRKWETLIDGPQHRRVVFRGTRLQAIRAATFEGQTLGQPVFLFDKKGEISTRLDICTRQ